MPAGHSRISNPVMAAFACDILHATHRVVDQLQQAVCHHALLSYPVVDVLGHVLRMYRFLLYLQEIGDRLHRHPLDTIFIFI